MNMLRFSLVVFTLSINLCLIPRQSFAQSFTIPTGTGQPPISITPNATPAVPPGVPAVAGVVSSDPTKKPPLPKYYEFKSICIQDEEPLPIQSAPIKEKRISLIQKKLDQAQAAKNSMALQQIKALLIKEYIKQDDYRKAEEIFLREGISLSETDRVLIAADIDVHKELPKQAKNNLNKYLETHPKDIAALEKLATVYTRLGYHTDAVVSYEDLMKMNPKGQYLEALCRSTAQNADHVNVIKYCHQLQTQNPKNNIADIYIGISQRDQENYKEAIKSFEKSLKIKPSEFASTCLAESFLLNKEFPKAVKQFEESVKIKPESKRAHLGLANTYIKQNLYKEALEQFKESCRLGLQPLIEMTAVGNNLRSQKSDLANVYFDEMQKCKK